MKTASLAKRAAEALASDAKKEQEKTKAKKNASNTTQDQNARRNAKKAAEQAEKEVQRAEQRVAELRRELDDPDLYDGSADKAKRAGKLDKELAAAQRLLDDAMTRWEAIVADE